MGRYEIRITDDLDQICTEIAGAANTTIEDILQNFIEQNLQKSMVDIVVDQYKRGNLKAREAWKLSGLSYQEFQNLAMS